jgi:hypothetical protein
MQCCEYHATPTVLLKKKPIHLPVYICFNVPGTRVIGILHDFINGQVQFADSEKKTTTWTKTCETAIKLAGKQIKIHCNFFYLWTIHVDGRDMTLWEADKKYKFSLNKINPIKLELSSYHCNAPYESEEIKKKTEEKTEEKTKEKIGKKRTVDDTKTPTQQTKPTNMSKLKASKKEQDDDNYLIDVSEEEDDFCWTPEDSFWSTTFIQEYLLRFPESAPKLLRIEAEFHPVCIEKKFSCPFFKCVFEQPSSKEEKLVDISGTILYNFSQYITIIDLFRKDST